MEFKNINSIDELLKKATVTVLLEKISYVSKYGFSVIPVQCPAIADNKEGLLYMGEGKAVCMRNTEECPYLEAAVFDIKGYIKEIQCRAR